MDRKFILIGLLLIFLLSSSIVSADTIYKAGDTIKIRTPPSGFGHTALQKPKYMLYTLYNPSGEIVFEENHPLIYVHETVGPGIAYEYYDEYEMRIPAFSQVGKWKLSKTLHSEVLWVLDSPDVTKDLIFEVGESNLLENLLAPWYFTKDMGLFIGRISGGLPFHPYLIGVVIGIIIAVVLIVKVVVNLAVPLNGTKKNGARK
ncbi:MAG: hypothetical protein IMZ53_16515 [Thermoplasmata archaeon]|nr:hypothetical protein [Thermoplasmata archaeon]MBE3142177.1 hypothetical protein [Thermoplasmata archaeon]